MTVHGGDARTVARSLGLDPGGMLDLSASCNPFAPDPGPLLVAAIESGALGRYPDDHDRATATGAMARALGVDPERVVLTNGGAEAIALVAAELRRGWVDDPDFSLYARHLDAVVPGAPRFRSDPHNPSGTLAPDTEAAAVWDEAFYPLARGRWTRGPGAGARSDPAIVVGSLTKVLGCPGLRLGYVVAPDDDGDALGVPGLARRLIRRQPQWAVATPSLAVLPELVGGADLVGWARAIARQRAALAALLGRHGLVPQPSDANFVLVDVSAAAGLRTRLAREGVVVRDCTSFGLPDCVRIAVPDDDGLECLDRALARAAEQVAP